MRRIAVVAMMAAAELASGCGKKQSLVAGAGQTLPVKAVTSPARLTPDELLNTTAQQRPTRFNELVTRSQELQSDRFDMPPQN